MTWMPLGVFWGTVPLSISFASSKVSHVAFCGVHVALIFTVGNKFSFKSDLLWGLEVDDPGTVRYDASAKATFVPGGAERTGRVDAVNSEGTTTRVRFVGAMRY